MGCDIHPHIEYKHSGNSVYEWFASPSLGGDYLLFALLAGVRTQWVEEHLNTNITAIFIPRGIPEDTSSETSRGHDGYEYWSESTRTWEFDGECHSGSWLNTDELRVVLETYLRTLGDSIEAYKSQYGVEWGIELRATLRAMEALPNARIVFWFDN